MPLALLVVAVARAMVDMFANARCCWTDSLSPQNEALVCNFQANLLHPQTRPPYFQASLFFFLFLAWGFVGFSLPSCPRAFAVSTIKPIENGKSFARRYSEQAKLKRQPRKSKKQTSIQFCFLFFEAARQPPPNNRQATDANKSPTTYQW